jgi:hypothetical protein
MTGTANPVPTDLFPLTTIGHGDLRAVFAPTLGGRMLSLRVRDEELLWQNPALVGPDLRPAAPLATWPRGDGGMGTWANVGGSKTWPAPQGWTSADEWAGPPDPVFDAGAWTVVEHTPTSIRLRSAPDARTGLLLERAFTLGDADADADADAGVGSAVLDERITMTNVGDRTTRWAPWEVCQVRTDDGGTVIVAGAGAADEIDLGLWAGSLVSDVTPDGIALPVGTGIAKRGYRAGRSVGYRRASGTTIALSSPVEPEDGAPYPDGGALFEVWLQRPVAEPIAALEGLRPDAHLAELEVLGRRSALAPSAHRATSIRWTVSRPVGGDAQHATL